ncbi:MAG: AbrB/MazE/SpoVT family DNA-binding domain-containing protein [Candidatus Woesearchaeota archaeon]|nr:AbrB/MazE/SpoVT family DNA-binding domain-containing protein [Candidatus Woesearchaeota archaeon]
MKKYSDRVSFDSRGQLIIPKEVRKEFLIEEGAAFWAFIIEKEGILLKRVKDEAISENDFILKELSEKNAKIGFDKKSIPSAVKRYQRKESRRFEEL